MRTIARSILLHEEITRSRMWDLLQSNWSGLFKTQNLKGRERGGRYSSQLKDFRNITTKCNAWMLLRPTSKKRARTSFFR